MKTALVTGASTGIGAACVRRLAAGGWHVLAGVRNAGDAPDRAEEVLLDVTDQAAIAAAAEPVDRLDGLVNNAGIGIAAPLESIPLDELRRQLEVNVVGQVAVTQAFLPALRAAHGRIVLMGSISGRSAIPFLGAYAMSKHALEAMADALRIELAPDGISVSIVEPGTIATPIWTKPQTVVDELDEEATARYGPRIAAFRVKAAERAAQGASTDGVAAAVEHALTAATPKTRYLVGRDAKLRAAIEHLPDRVRDRVITRALLGG